ncbi:hypothetical protein B9Q04_13840 [Candidatus Marsarchaeota G2 archaeon BE_D]|jgi:hypothetical protein|uniref:Uncharacterized protein n=1 Tax=Candidatus Marsarchaeota G2 archaeon BE_D TaxID=1978158 RepID=A0A2R6C7L4_9ARCH|nr:MAG: hypothetical protein B9Q04_13840 [Candidatus Marsarchaeota G2 archaeon BE_D]
MAKALFLIISGAEAPAKAELGIVAAARSVKAKRYEDLKVIFFGPSQEYLTRLTGTAKEHFEILLKEKAVDSACIAVAERMNITQQLESLGLELLPAGERIAHYVNQGYEVITF